MMEARERLDELGRALNKRGLKANLLAEDPPLLHVVNPGVAMLKDVVGCESDDAGELWFKWAALDVLLGKADDVPSAVERVMFVLSVADEL